MGLWDRCSGEWYCECVVEGQSNECGICRHVGDGNFHAALIFDPTIPGEFEKVDEAAHRVSVGKSQ